MTDSPRIDAHQHFWQFIEPFDHAWLDVPEYAPIRRDFLPADLEPLIRAGGIDHTVFVQTQHNLQENRWALALADQSDFIAGIVGWVDLTSSECERQLVEFRQHRKAVGIRHITQGEPDDNFIVREDVLRGLRVLEKHHVPFELLFYVRHLHHAATLARKLPDLPLVIDHLAKPQINEHRIDNWEANLRAAAVWPNVFCKLSGMVTEADWEHWTSADLKPYVQIALDAFGPERCMFGSDWPVCALAASYAEVIAALNDALGPISSSERDQIFGGTAAKFYGLAP